MLRDGPGEFALSIPPLFPIAPSAARSHSRRRSLFQRRATVRISHYHPTLLDSPSRSPTGLGRARIPSIRDYRWIALLYVRAGQGEQSACASTLVSTSSPSLTVGLRLAVRMSRGCGERIAYLGHGGTAARETQECGSGLRPSRRCGLLTTLPLLTRDGTLPPHCREGSCCC